MGVLRQRWDWLRDLLARGRMQLALPIRGSRNRHEALRDALERLGIPDGELLEGVAAVLGVSTQTLAAPGPRALATAAGDDLAQVLPLLLEHRSEAMRRIARAWLGLPESIYSVAGDQAERWLTDSVAVGDLLAPRVDGEGLAWLGPRALQRLASAAASMHVRDAARAWCGRLHEADR